MLKIARLEYRVYIARDKPCIVSAGDAVGAEAHADEICALPRICDDSVRRAAVYEKSLALTQDELPIRQQCAQLAARDK